jgi:hypothetical protein
MCVFIFLTEVTEISVEQRRAFSASAVIGISCIFNVFRS